MIPIATNPTTESTDSQEAKATESLEELLAPSIDEATLLDLVEQMRPSAAHYMRKYRPYLPAYLEVEDLVQEAALVMYTHRGHASSKQTPLDYLRACGHLHMFHRCVDLREPTARSLDAPVDSAHDTHLYELVPSDPLVPQAEQPSEQAEYAPLSEAFSQLSPELRTVLAHRFGLDGQPVTSLRAQAQSGAPQSTLRWQERKALFQLYFQLRDQYPQYATHVLAGFAHGDENWRKLDRAYTELQTQGVTISGQALAKATGVRKIDVQAFLQEREGARRPNMFHRDTQRTLDRATTSGATPNGGTRGRAEVARNPTNSCSCCGRPTNHEGYCGRCLDF